MRTGILNLRYTVTEREFAFSVDDTRDRVTSYMKHELIDKIQACIADGRTYVVRSIPIEEHQYEDGNISFEGRVLIALLNIEDAEIGDVCMRISNEYDALYFDEVRQTFRMVQDAHTLEVQKYRYNLGGESIEMWQRVG